MKIVQIEPPNSGGEGDHVYRTVYPCRALGELPGVEVLSGSALSTDLVVPMEECDVLILCDAAELEYLTLIERRRRRGKITVYEINDNFLGIQPWNPTADFSRDPAHCSLMLQLGKRCDGLQFSMPQLERVFGTLNRNTAVFPNNLWEVPGWKPNKEEIVTVGWGGSYGHLEDVKWLMPVFEWILQTYPEVRLSIMSSGRLRKLFSWAPRDRFAFREAGSLEDYYSFLSELDIGVAPLLQTEFNRCRSDVKFLEFASRGVVPVCSDWWPYRDSVRSGVNGLLFNGLDELKDQLTLVLASRIVREDIADAAYDYVATQRVERQRVSTRLEFYDRLLGESVGKPMASLPPTEFPPGGRVSFPDSDYREVAFGRGERHLYNALLAQKETRLALEDVKKAAACLEGNHWPYLIEGALCSGWEDGVGALKQALELKPHSGSANFLLGKRYEEGGEVEKAEACYSEFLKQNSFYAPGFERLGLLLEKKGQVARAESCFIAALEANEFYSPVRYRLIEYNLKRGDIPAAKELSESRGTLNNSDWRGLFWEGRVAFEAKELEVACATLERAWGVFEEEEDNLSTDKVVPGLTILEFWSRAELARGGLDIARGLLGRYRSFLPEERIANSDGELV